MTHIDGEIIINRPAEVVFDFVADERNEPRFNPRMARVELVSPGPIGAGSRFHAEMTTMGRTTPMSIEFTGYDRPRRLASRTSMSTMDIDGELTFETVPAGTRMRWSWTLTPRGAMRLLGPVVARTGRRQEREIWTSLKRLLEQDGGPS